MVNIGGASIAYSSGVHDTFERRHSSVIEASIVAIGSGTEGLYGAFLDSSRSKGDDGWIKQEEVRIASSYRSSMGLGESTCFYLRPQNVDKLHMIEATKYTQYEVKRRSNL